MKISIFTLCFLSCLVNFAGCGSAARDASEKNNTKIDASAVLTSTSPVHESDNASIFNQITLVFSQPMDWSTLIYDIKVKTSESEEYFANTKLVDKNTNTMVLVLPATLAGENGRLLSNTTYTVTIPKKSKTEEGKTLSRDISLQFKTFKYQLLYDDSAIVNGETWGMDFHANTNSLYYLGEANNEIVIRRFNLANEFLETKYNYGSSVQVMYGGMDIWGDSLYANESYDSNVRQFSIDSVTGNLSETALYNQIDINNDGTYAANEPTLSEVRSTARIGETRYFTTGNWHGGDAFQDVLSYNGTSTQWATTINGKAWGFANDEDKVVDAINVDGKDYIILAEPVSDTLYRFSASGSFVDSKKITALLNFDSSHTFYEFDLSHDRLGNIFLATGGGVYKISGGDLTLLDKREGVEAGRIAVKNHTTHTQVFYLSYRQPAKVSYVEFAD